jgi:hypothetical protein
MAEMRLSCATCGTWTVVLRLSTEIWSSVNGQECEFARGTCITCHSVLLLDPSKVATKTAAARVQASNTALRMQKMAEGEG